jgi:exopolysaccharide biosynthesis predicted pyruvyltransferase EpsI
MIPHIAYPSEENTQVLIITRDKREFILNCTAEQYLSGKDKYEAGAMMQDAFSFLDDDAREFLISGIFPDEWKATFGKEEEYEDNL